MTKDVITEIKAREILDSKARPMVEVDVITGDGYRPAAGIISCEVN